ncbi:Sac2 family-domain-containing protein [Rhodofomes roseus]|uniref:Sac2 family-domain-containing protein n=1 Tax=Rhodofomes roseus TaxID=34475 RepID=A0ABQ8L0F7_9APHY|nr:Sac2 family-domain-containing protein [Rhodofomes roseus]KAH9844190.1 Sac2 family-domain-containing protein [Rhodofomes roseus]
MDTNGPSLLLPGMSQEPRSHLVNESGYSTHAQDFVDLHKQVQSSVSLLDSLENFLSTFQKDLSAVSGQISTLQDRSKDIENRLKSRRRIEKPLSNLLADLCIPPELATIILDTPVGEPWIEAIGEFESRLDALKVRARVKAARDLTEVAEGMRIVAATKLRAFFLALLQPIRTSMTTNMQVMQTSIFLKYKPLFLFIQRQAPNVANEVQRAYVGAARTYYETGFRRYIRSLGYVKARAIEKADVITAGASEAKEEPEVDFDRLGSSRINGPGVVLAHIAEEKSFKEPIEAVVRSLLLVLMDNASAEYTFVTTFFASEQRRPTHQKRSSGSIRSPTSLLSPTDGNSEDGHSVVSSDYGASPRQRITSIGSIMALTEVNGSTKDAKEEQTALNAVWKQIMDPVLDYCQIFLKGVLEPTPPVVPLLIIIRLTEDVMAELQKRNCGPLETFIFSVRLQMWPVFQKAMGEHIESVKKLAEGTTSSLFRRGTTTTDLAVTNICRRYVVLFNSFIALTEQPEETMIFSNLLRLRQELSKLIASHTDKITDPAAKASAQNALYDVLLQNLSRGARPSSHPRAQSEMAFWRGRDEESEHAMVDITVTCKTASMEFGVRNSG